MTRLVWGDSGSRKFETGIDRGVLYAPSAPGGVAWNGITAVNENPSGGAPQSYYLDGIKYLQVSGAEEYAATIQALSAPAEFAECDGTGQIYAGLFVTQQPRKQFDFAYRTLVGNDVAGETAGYKLHLIYNALAAPSSRDNQTLSTTATPVDMSWALTTVPPLIPGYKPTAHLVIDTMFTDTIKLNAIENLLYGTDGVAARMPTPTEIIAIFAEIDTLVIVDNGDGTFTASGPAGVVDMLDSSTFQITDPGVTILDGNSYTLTSS